MSTELSQRLDRRVYVVTILATLALFGMSVPLHSGDLALAAENRAISPSSVVSISPDKIAIYEKKALDGNGKVAYLLYLHFEASHSSSRAAYWARIAAENGDRDAQYALAALLFESETPIGCRRAQFWIDRATKTKMEIGASAAIPNGISALTSRFKRKCGTVEPDVGPLP